ncbi:coiled-coil domain-containing protein 63 [Ischnura elegans]|uniref:coiled-coil domain-containing protein 63 n=1 Tax=Ischnura elegans TaxID=197161 RepID=UPI001ED87CF0|nr:coiled-coil domain-containing protein 63 [Ischnura elegans]XP_046387057.1 coiled-coil domain-containing protein 63 [Ischnura elegans]
MAGLVRKPAAQDELEMDQMAEAELARLQRQYRIMEGDRAAYSEEMKFILYKQKKMIEVLEEEKKELSLNIKIANSPSNKHMDVQTSSTLNQLFELHEKYEQDIKNEKTQISEIEYQIRKVHKEIAVLKKSDISDHTYQSKQIASQKTIKMLENRLDNVSVKFNKTLAVNATLREDIDHLLKERGRFSALYQQLIGRVISGKKIMNDLIDQASQAYDQREEAQAKLHALRMRGALEQQKHSHEMRELHRRYDHDTKLQDFLTTKGQKRTMAELEAKEAQKKISQRETMEKMIYTYQSLLEQIKEFCGESDIDKLAAQFIKQEEENFALFNYINELNSELEVLKEQVVDLKEKIEEQKGADARRELQQEETLSELQDELKKCMDESQVAERKLQKCQNILNNLLEGIEALFAITHCDNTPILELLGDNTHVTTFNVMLYLGIIEKRCIDLNNVVYYLERKASPEVEEFDEDYLDDEDEVPEEIYMRVEGLSKQNPPNISELVAEVPCSLCLEQQVDAIEDTEENNEPLDQEGVKETVEKTIECPGTKERLHSEDKCRAPYLQKMFQR